MTEITDSVKKSQKRLFLALFYMFFSVFEGNFKVNKPIMFFSVFEGNFKVNKPMLTLSISLLIFGVFLKNQGLNLQHADFIHFFKEVCPTF